MKSKPKSYLFPTLLGCILAVAMAMLTAVFVAGQRAVVVVMPPQTQQIATALPAPATAPTVAPAPAAAATPTAAAPAAAAAPAPPKVLVARVNKAPQLKNPLDPIWQQIDTVELPLQPQQMTEPMLAAPTISNIHVQALRDDARLVMRLSWEQPIPSQHSNIGQFTDAVAIQFPMVDGAPFTMGAKDMPVRLLLWRAMWQKDVDDGFQDVVDQHPNAWTDMYWFAQGGHPFSMETAFEDKRSHQWLIPYSAGNPNADFKRTKPVGELVAEGFSTVTAVPQTPSNARGVWNNGRWTVVIDRPLDSSDPLVQRLTESSQFAASFAVWDGAAGNAGGRKHWCNWVPLQLEP